MLGRLFQKRAAVESRFTLHSENQVAGSFFRPGGTGVNWAVEAGDFQSNSTVAIGLGNILDLVAQGKITATKTVGSRQEIDQRAALLALDFLQACPFGLPAFLKTIAGSMKVYGMAYALVERDKGGRPAYLIPLSAMMVARRVRYGELLFEITQIGGSGTKLVVPESEVIVFRHGNPDPLNPGIIVSPLMVMAKEICGDNEASTFLTSVLRNSGVPGVVIVPKERMAEGDGPTLKARSRIAEMWRALTRDRRGEPFVSPFPVDIHQIGFSPDNVKAVSSASYFKSLILAALNIDPMAAGLPSENKTYANYGEARKALIEDSILPLWAEILDPITAFLKSNALWAGVRDMTVLTIDRSSYPQLNYGELERMAALRDDFKAGLISRGEARQAFGYDTETKDATSYFDLLASAKGAAARSRLSPSERRRLEILHAEDDAPSPT